MRRLLGAVLFRSWQRRRIRGVGLAEHNVMLIANDFFYCTRRKRLPKSGQWLEVRGNKPKKPFAHSRVISSRVLVTIARKITSSPSEQPPKGLQ